MVYYVPCSETILTQTLTPLFIVVCVFKHITPSVNQRTTQLFTSRKTTRLSIACTWLRDTLSTRTAETVAAVAKDAAQCESPFNCNAYKSSYLLTYSLTWLHGWYWLSGFSVRMLTRSQSYVLEMGAGVQLECQFYADSFNLFDFPVVWHKLQQHTITAPVRHHQRTSSATHHRRLDMVAGDVGAHLNAVDEDCQVNMMGNLLEPFASSHERYHATFESHPPRYLFALDLTGTKPLAFELNCVPCWQM